MSRALRLIWWTLRTSFLRWQLRLTAVLAATLLWCLLIGAAALVYAAVRGRIAEARLESAWAATLGERGFPERFPATEPNATAVRLEELARGVGVRFDDPRPDEAEDDDEIGDLLEGYFRDLIASETTTLPAPPEPAREWLAASRDRLAPVVDLLLEGERPIYRSDVGLGYKAPIPEVLPSIALSRRILLAAIDDSLGGDDEAAARHLEASWRLSAPLWERPELVSQLVAHAVARCQLALLRRRPWLEGDWVERLASLDPRAGMLTALRLEAWMATRTESMKELDEPPRWLWRWLMHEYALAVHAAVEEMAATDILQFQSDEFFAARFSRLPRWNLVAKILFPNLWDSWPKAHRLAIDLELTRRMIVLCAEPDRLAALDGAALPSVVDGLSWRYRAAGPGATIRLDGAVGVHYQERRVDLPTSGGVDLAECRRRR